MIIGGQAVLLYGEPRLTKDIDITLGMGIEGLEKLRRIVRTLALKPLVKNVDQFVKETMVMPMLDEKSGIRIDFIFSFSLYEKQAIENANIVEIGDTKIRFASLEDVVIHKIIAGRARDLEDIESILLKNPDYDEKYILKWLDEFDKSLNESYAEKFTHLMQRIKKEG